jgi:hypothetical protein
MSSCASKDTSALVMASLPLLLKTFITKVSVISSAELTLNFFFQNFLMFFLKEVDSGAGVSTVIGVGSVSIRPPKLVSSSEEEEEVDSKSAKINNYCSFKW